MQIILYDASHHRVNITSLSFFRFIARLHRFFESRTILKHWNLFDKTVYPHRPTNSVGLCGTGTDIQNGKSTGNKECLKLAARMSIERFRTEQGHFDKVPRSRTTFGPRSFCVARYRPGINCR